MSYLRNAWHLEIMEASIGRDLKRATECLSDHLSLTTKNLLDRLSLEEKQGVAGTTRARRMG
jgi:DNA-binding GntR family transcriptional regulator